MATAFEAWEKKLNVIFKEIDAALEARYGTLFARKRRPGLRPAEPAILNMTDFLTSEPRILSVWVQLTAKDL